MASSIPEQLISQVFSLLGDDVTTAIGRRETAVHAGPNRVVAVPLGAPSIVMASRPGDLLYVDQGRMLLERHFNIEWYCHGYRDENADTQDFARAEALYLATLLACRQSFHHSVEFSDETWEDQQEGADGFERFGSLIRFMSTIKIPFYEPRGGIVTLTATPPIVTTFTLNETQETE